MKLIRFTLYVEPDVVAALSWLAVMTGSPKMYLAGELLKKAVDEAVNDLMERQEQALLDLDEERSDEEPPLSFMDVDDELSQFNE